MSLPIYQRVAVTDAGDVIPGAEYTVINENTGVAAPIYSDRAGATLLSAPYFADSAGTIQFFIAQGTTFRVAASGGVGTYTDRYIYGISEAVFVSDNGNVGIGTVPDAWKSTWRALDVGVAASLYSQDGNTAGLASNVYFNGTNWIHKNTGAVAFYQQNEGSHIFYNAASGTAGATLTPLERLRIDSSGNVGIGTSSPAGVLDLGEVGTTGANTIFGVGSTSKNYFTTNTNGSHVFRRGTNQDVTIDGAGNLLVGTTDAAVGVGNTNIGHSIGAIGYAAHSRNSGVPMFVNRNNSDGNLITFNKDGGEVGNIGASGGDLIIGTNDTGLAFLDGGNFIAPWNITTNAARDNAVDLGTGSIRFNDAYITNGVTAGSDRTLKQDILEITAAEYNVAKVCKGLLRSFRWIDAVEEKGDDARIHFGIIAQDLQDAFTAEGLDVGRYAMFMSDTWWETQTEVAAVEAVKGVEFVQAVEASEALYSEDGELVSEAVEAVEGVEGVEAVEAKDAYTRTDTFQTLAEAPEGATECTRLGVRYSELLAFIIAAL